MVGVETGQNNVGQVEQGSLNIKSIIEGFGNSEQEKQQLKDALNSNFDSVLDELKADKQFKSAVCELLKNEELDVSVRDSLKALAVKLDLEEKSDGTWGEKAVEGTEIPDNQPHLIIDGTLDNVVKGENQNPSYGKDVIVQKSDGDEKLDDNLKLYLTKGRIESMQNKVNDFSSNEKLLDKKDDFDKLSGYLDKMMDAILDPSVSNVKILQEFINDNIKNLNNNEFTESEFKKANKYNEQTKEFDGSFGKSTLKYLNGVITVIEEYVNNVGGYLKNKEQGKPQADIETTNEATTEQTPSGPLDVDGKKYPPFTNVPITLEGATFYDNNSISETSAVSGDAEKPQCESVQFVRGKEVTCFMKIENDPNSCYEVKFDTEGNLCPLAINYNTKNKVLLKDIPSCCNYLKAKAPAGAEITWSADKQDYMINSYRKSLTIEPMTIDGKWITSDLSKCLRLLDFTNLLRGSSGIVDSLSGNNLEFENDNPDLKMDDKNLYIKLKKNQKRGENEKGGNRYPIQKEYFGLSDDELKDFIKYNNGEKWRNKWDKNDKNKYSKIVVVAGKAVIPQGVASSESFVGNKGMDVSSPSLTQEIGSSVISTLNITKLDDGLVTSIRQDYNIPGNAVVYKKSLKSGNDSFYYQNGNDVFCVGSIEDESGRQNNECRKKWMVSGDNYDSYTESVNICSKGKDALNVILSQSLVKMKEDGLVEGDNDAVSINIKENKYVFVNGETEFSINDDVLLGSGFLGLEGVTVENRMKILYLVSENVPGEFTLNDGNIVKGGEGAGSVVISGEDLSNFGIKDDESKQQFIGFINTVSKGLNDKDSSDDSNLGGNSDSPVANRGDSEGEDVDGSKEQIVVYPGGSYNGKLQNDKREGFGTYVWENGNEYSGEWENDMMKSGEITIHADDGNKVYVVERDNNLMHIMSGPDNVGKYIDQNNGGKIVDGPSDSYTKLGSDVDQLIDQNGDGRLDSSSSDSSVSYA